MSIFIQLNSNEILTLNQFAGQKTHRKHTENIVDEINTALYNRDNLHREREQSSKRSVIAISLAF